MITIDWILNTAVSTIKKQFPEAIYSGYIVDKNRVFDPSTNKTSEAVSKNDVEIILDNLTVEEIQASGLLSSDLKLYIIGDKDYDVSYDKYIEYMSYSYRVEKVVETIVGSKSALWTIICRK